MKTPRSWLRFPIYLNGDKRFDANSTGDLEVVDAFNRMSFVFENIEFCYAEGRCMDIEIHYRLEELDDRISQNDVPYYVAQASTRILLAIATAAFFFLGCLPAWIRS